MKAPRLFRNFSATALPLLLGAAALGCSEDAPKADPGPSATGTGTDLIGTFQVELAAEDESTTILGKVSSGPTPAQLSWEEVAADGDCKLSKPIVPFCDPGCGSDVCVEGGVCQPYPEGRNAGEVRVSGLATADGAADFALIKVSTNYQAPPSVELAFPPFAEGSTVRFDAAGGDVPAFGIEARGIAALVATNGALTLAAGEPLELGWEASSDPSSTELHVELDISHHGGTKGVIECETADDGSLSIAAELVDQLVALGVAGFPTVVLSRSAVGSTSIAAGRIELVLTSDVELAVEVPGVVSCTEDAECPDGTTCQTDLTCN